MTDSEKLDLLLNKVTNIDERVTKLDEKFTKLDERVSNLDEKVTNIDERVTKLDEKFTKLDEKVSKLDNSVTDIKLTLENEIRVNIQRVAEGHLDLSRNLHDAMIPSNEIEMLSIKVRMIESDMRELKNKVASM
jgi:predicted  nucleic acid-binding Zn-ribbon protein